MEAVWSARSVWPNSSSEPGFFAVPAVCGRKFTWRQEFRLIIWLSSGGAECFWEINACIKIP